MKIRVDSNHPVMNHHTQSLMRRMLNPVTGLTRLIGFSTRGMRDPRFITSGASLTGVHVLRQRPDPGPGFYHIGGSGIVLNEALIRCLGETAERYAQFMSDVTGQHQIHVASYDEMATRGETLLSAEKLEFFSQQQYAQDGFPYKPFDHTSPMGWLRVSSWGDAPDCWVPAQLLLVGYLGRQDERRLLSSVTTGTAAHTQPSAALRNALLELSLIDSAMGHWYSAATAPRIEMDGRTRAIGQLMDRYFPAGWEHPDFYWLSNPDLPGLSVACVVRRPGEVPAVGVGLGIGMRLSRAMYSALLEGVGVIQLMRKSQLSEPNGNPFDVSAIQPDGIYDLDSNVLYYAQPSNAGFIDTKFSLSDSIAASALPGDRNLEPCEESRVLVNGFLNAGKELYWLDLTTPDLQSLGFVVSRVWSPDTLSLCMPSAPPTQHLRFRDYGGVSHMQPHPYP